ncbi:MAG: hypothetical protein AAFP67_04405 [Pseudomonadota bacterium]
MNGFVRSAIVAVMCGLVGISSTAEAAAYQLEGQSSFPRGSFTFEFDDRDGDGLLSPKERVTSSGFSGVGEWPGITQAPNLAGFRDGGSGNWQFQRGSFRIAVPGSSVDPTLTALTEEPPVPVALPAPLALLAGALSMLWLRRAAIARRVRAV